MGRLLVYRCVCMMHITRTERLEACVSSTVVVGALYQAGGKVHTVHRCEGGKTWHCIFITVVMWK